MRKNRTLIVMALAFYAFIAVAYGENLFFGKNNALKLKSWGQIKNKPEGAGEVKLENMQLTIKTLKKPKDLKLLKVLKLKPATKYVLKLIAHRTGEGKRRSGIYVYFRADGEKKFQKLAVKKVSKTESPEEVVLDFSVPDAKGIVVIDIYAPYDIGGVINVSDISVTEES